MVISQNLDKIFNELKNDENPPTGYIEDKTTKNLEYKMISNKTIANY